jgi:hypothetical protein
MPQLTDALTGALVSKLTAFAAVGSGGITAALRAYPVAVVPAVVTVAGAVASGVQVVRIGDAGARAV